jgi:hypothetical protein
VAAIEVKYTAAPSISRSLAQGIADINTHKNYIVIPQGEHFMKSGNVMVCSLAHFLTHELPSL